MLLTGASNFRCTILRELAASNRGCNELTNTHWRLAVMKSLIYTIFAASVLAAPVVSIAQSDSPVTRTQVRAELKQLELAGYMPASGDEPSYPANIQAAEARIAVQNDAASGYGGAVSGSSASGGGAATHPASAGDMNKLYGGQ
ncbi:DUF4148 domain-containing protein [Caballeronia humi]